MSAIPTCVELNTGDAKK